MGLIRFDEDRISSSQIQFTVKCQYGVMSMHWNDLIFFIGERMEYCIIVVASTEIPILHILCNCVL